MKPAHAETLPRCTPESQGVSSQVVLDFRQTADRQVDSMHSFMLVRHGKVVAEAWWAPESAEQPHVLWSLSKSFTSTAVGMAVAVGKLSLDDHVLNFFPEDALAAGGVRFTQFYNTGRCCPTRASLLTGLYSHQAGMVCDSSTKRERPTSLFFSTLLTTRRTSPRKPHRKTSPSLAANTKLAGTKCVSNFTNFTTWPPTAPN